MICMYVRLFVLYIHMFVSIFLESNNSWIFQNGDLVVFVRMDKWVDWLDMRNGTRI